MSVKSEQKNQRLTKEIVNGQLGIVNFRLKDFLNEVSIVAEMLMSTLDANLELEKENKHLREDLEKLKTPEPQKQV
jgi:regulator of replication initiation timing